MSSFKRLKGISRLLPLVGIVPLALIFRALDVNKALGVMANAQVPLLLLSGLLVAAESVTKSVKLKTLVNTHGRCDFRASLKVYLNGILFGAVSPGKVGDFVKVYALSRESGISIAHSFAIICVERLIEIVCLFTLALMGLVMLGTIEGLDFTIMALIIGSITLSLPLFYLMGQKVSHRASNQAKHIVFKIQERLGLELADNTFLEALCKTYRPSPRLASALLFGFLGWEITFLRSYTLAMSLGINISFQSLMLLWPIISVIELLPISIQGIGPREYAVSYLLAKFDVPVESAVVLSLLSFVIFIVPLVLIGCATLISESFFKQRKSDQENKKDSVEDVVEGIPAETIT